MSNYPYRHAFGVAIITLLVYWLTLHPLTRPYGFHFLLISSIGGLTLLVFKKYNHTLVIYNALITLLFTVGITGWFFSPFFSWLYIAAIALSFVLDTWASYAFILVFIAVFIPNIGSIDARFDILSLVSLLSLIPLSYIMRKEFLGLKESEKKILILEKDHNKTDTNLTKVLSNRVSKMAVELREPINDIKQLSYYAANKKSNTGLKEVYEKTNVLAEKALGMLTTFEEDVTGKKLAKNKKTRA